MSVQYTLVESIAMRCGWFWLEASVTTQRPVPGSQVPAHEIALHAHVPVLVLQYCAVAHDVHVLPLQHRFGHVAPSQTELPPLAAE